MADKGKSPTAGNDQTKVSPGSDQSDQSAHQAGPASQSEVTEEDSERYIQDLIARGEAAEAVNGVLPPGATHEIIRGPDGKLTVRRRRYY